MSRCCSMASASRSKRAWRAAPNDTPARGPAPARPRRPLRPGRPTGRRRCRAGRAGWCRGSDLRPPGSPPRLSTPAACRGAPAATVVDLVARHGVAEGRSADPTSHLDGARTPSRPAAGRARRRPGPDRTRRCPRGGCRASGSRRRCRGWWCGPPGRPRGRDGGGQARSSEPAQVGDGGLGAGQDEQIGLTEGRPASPPGATRPRARRPAGRGR